MPYDRQIPDAPIALSMLPRLAGLVGTTGTAIVSIVKAVQASRKAGDASQQVYSDWAPQSNVQIYNES